MAFVYLWYVKSTRKFYLGVHNGKDPYYTHSSFLIDRVPIYSSWFEQNSVRKKRFSLKICQKVSLEK